MSFYYSRAHKHSIPPSYNFQSKKMVGGEYDDYGFYCDMEECEPIQTVAHLKYKVHPKNDSYYKKLSYDIINEQCIDIHICDIRSNGKLKPEINNEKLNIIAQRLQIYMHIGVGCVFVATSWILFSGMVMN